MKNFKQIFILALGVLFLSQNLAASEPISTGRYIGGGLVGTFVGFGIGNAINGSWTDTGWLFTTFEVAGAGLIVGGFVMAGSPFMDFIKEGPSSSTIKALSDSAQSKILTGVILAAGGALIYSGFRIAEIVDVWAAPTLESSTPKSSAMLNSGLVNTRYSYLMPAAQETPIMGFKFKF